MEKHLSNESIPDENSESIPDGDAEADEQPAQQAGGKFLTLSRSHHRALERQYLGSKAPAPKISDLEAQMAELKALYKQKFGEDCDAGEDAEADEQPVQQAGGKSLTPRRPHHRALERQYLGGGMGGVGAPAGDNTAGMLSGTVKGWVGNKGFGFVAPADGGDNLFCHRSVFEDGHALEIGSPVMYVAGWDDQKGKMAITKLAGAVGVGDKREKGTVKSWSEEKGFGFVESGNGGETVRRLYPSARADGQLLPRAAPYYTQQWDDQRGKIQAINVMGAAPGMKYNKRDVWGAA
jgi:cold shock CspA family protein